MNLARLQELTNLVESTSKNTAANLNEGRSTMSDFDGIRSIVEDALGDLSDKLGKSGSLAALMKSSGAAKLDTVKDADGKNIQAQIVAKTVEYKKAMEKLLMEAEMLLSQVDESEELDGEPLTEGMSYSDSAEFTDEFYTVMSKVNDIEKVIKHPRWMSYMKTTDTNYGTECEGHAQDAKSAVTALKSAMNNVNEEFDKTL